jgi:chemotaxis protein CheD
MIPAQGEERRVHLVQGDWLVTDDASVLVTTILGSCVAACMFDPLAKVGGMNHFLLPGDDASEGLSEANRHGVHLMELLVNGLMQRGASRERLKVKLFGGAKLMDRLSDVGARNAEFAERFVRAEGIELVSSSLRGTQGRRIQFWPTSGRARQTYLHESQAPTPEAPKRPPVAPKAGDLELF